MNATEHRDRLVVAGAATWTALAGPVAVHTGVVGLLLALGVLIVPPLAWPLAWRRPLPRLGLASAALAALSLALPRSPIAAVLVLGWLAFSATTAVAGAWRWWSTSRRVWIAALPAVATGWLAVGALMLLTSRAGRTIGEVPPPLTELGVAHFTFAGFGGTVMAAALIRAQRERSRRRGAATLAAVALVAGTATVAVGHLTVRPVELVGTAMVASAALLIADLSWSVAPRSTSAGRLLRLSAASVVLPMFIAADYSWHLVTASGFWSYELIASTHGVANALGFVGCGLLGWRALDRAGHDEPIRGRRSGRPPSSRDAMVAPLRVFRDVPSV